MASDSEVKGLEQPDEKSLMFLFLSFPMSLVDLKESIDRIKLSIHQMYCDPLLQQVRTAAWLGGY